jgi:hypothetical protein
MNAPFNTSILIPEGIYGYIAKPFLGEYAVPQIVAYGGGIPNATDIPDNLGAFRTEPLIWIGYSVNTRKPLPPGDPHANWTYEYIPKVFSCEHWETNYTVQLNYIAGQQKATVTNKTFMSKIIDTTYVPDQNASDGTLDWTVATPTSNYILPTPSEAVGRYRKTAAYHSIGLQLRTWLDGYLDFSNGIWPVTNTEASLTRLIDPTNNYLPVPDLMDQVQSLYEDFLLSLLAYPSFVIVVNASSTQDRLYPCTKTRLLNTYVYHVRDLWLSYGAIILATAIALYVGARSVHENGDRVRDANFSTIVASTRGPALEGLGWKKWSARGSVPGGVVGSVKLGYGKVPEEPGVRDGESPDFGRERGEYWGFGVEGDVRQIHERNAVAGMVRDYRMSRTSFDRRSKTSLVSP